MDISQPTGTVEPHKSTSANQQWFSVSTPKFILMAVCTLGIYELYWFYKNWMHVRNLENSQIWPFWRSLFSRFTAYFLFKRVRASAQENALANTVPAGGLAALYFLLTATWKLTEPYSLVAFLTFAPLLVVNEAMTEINRTVIHNFEQNSRIEGWNWIAVTFGGLTAVAVLFGAFLSPEV